LIYQFIKRLATPFSNWKAYKFGIIDAEGNILRKRSTLTKSEEKLSFTIFDVIILNLKKIISKLPAGRTRLANFAAALFLLKEENNLEKYEDIDLLYSSFTNQLQLLQENISALNHLALLEEKIEKISKQEAQEIGNRLGVDWTKVDLNQFRQGLEVEQEHSTDPELRVANTKEDLAKIVLAHLKEKPDYYTRLKKVEEDIPANSVGAGGVAGLQEPIVKKLPKKKFKDYLLER
jgi:hypothetical protein